MMAHTTMSQAELKAAAGQKTTGRKLTKPVFAYSLGWHENDGVTEAEQREAARESLRVLELEGLQALIICHNDTKHPHVHVLVNRVNPETGIAAPLSKSKEKLQAWALTYQRERGQDHCPAREENAQRKEQGQRPEPHPRIARPVFEFNRATGNDNISAEFVKNDQKQRDAQLYATGRAIKESHARQWAEQKRVYAVARQKIIDHGKRLKDQKAVEVKNEQKFKWKFLFSQQRYDREQFERREKGMLSKLFNAASVLRELRRGRENDGISTLFALLSGRERRMALAAMQERERRELANRIKDLTVKAGHEIDGQTRAALDKLRGQFLRECEKLGETQNRQRGEVREAWKTRNAERKEALAPYRARERTQGRRRKGRSRSAEDHPRKGGGYRPR